eukprot:CAMPEP_0176397078 /NCGR_PEP_ID=MMETSP0126-20121128/44828_1 /TAXON_ID=141414 ORGANISM="Strombidinopsis acuminatum, Strain SPMC142" /NCGR_SAMPLE_ID=MMETSP0126 /ASSEMBLY_ACC=CAM_ASM_000229 /LENGTH=113 /DNA_ID=CAMNT_0017771155 /DNA_START=12 /DNA_END=353 /DNA_ORIENTATION=-
MVDTNKNNNEDKYIHYKCSSFENKKLEDVYKYSIENQDKYFDEKAQALVWMKKYTQIIDKSDKYLHRWFPDGEMNICYNCVDRHVESGDGDIPAFYEDSVYTGVQKTWTYKDV